MKKLSVVAAALLAAALFFGCSNSSDSPVFGPALPASVGTNPFANNSYKYEYDGTSTVGFKFVDAYKFGASTVENVSSSEYNALDNMHTAYTRTTTTIYSYSYNTETKRLYLLQTSESTTIRRDSTVNQWVLGSFTNDDTFVAAYKTYITLAENELSGDALEAAVKQARINYFSSYGYTSTTGEAKVEDEVIRRYNEQKSRKRNLIESYCYDVDSTTFKKQDDLYMPASVKTLGDIYGIYEGTFDVKVGGVTVYTVTYNKNKYARPSVEDSVLHAVGYQISSVVGNVIYVNEAAIKGVSDAIWSYTPVSATLVGEEKSKTSLGFVVTLKEEGNAIGDVTVEYATLANHNVAYATPYTKY